MKIFKKLNSRGVAHHVALIVIVVGVACYGTYQLVRNYADTPPSPKDYVAQLNAACKPVVTAAKKLYPNLPASVTTTCDSGLLSALTSTMQATTPISLSSTKVTGPNLAACQVPVNWFQLNPTVVRKAKVFSSTSQQKASLANLNTLANICSKTASVTDQQANTAELNYQKKINHIKLAPTPTTAPASPTPTASSSYFSAFFSLPVESEDNIPLIAAINNAQSSVELVDYTFHDSALLQALANAHSRGVAVRVILDGHNGQNTTPYASLQAAGVPVEFGDINHYPITHEKSVLIDHTKAYIGTYNMSTCVYTTRRDFGVIDSDPSDVSAWLAVFNADWSDQLLSANEPQGDNLIWSPGSAPRLIALINSAQSSINFYDEELNNQSIIQALISAAARGVVVRGVMTDQSQWETYFTQLTNGGVQLHLFPNNTNELYIHAKVIVADNKTAYMGSINFTTQSTDTARELGIITTDSTVVSGLNNTFATDWSTPTSNSLQALGGSPAPASCN